MSGKEAEQDKEGDIACNKARRHKPQAKHTPEHAALISGTKEVVAGFKTWPEARRGVRSLLGSYDDPV
jgi:hypothetical protein